MKQHNLLLNDNIELVTANTLFHMFGYPKGGTCAG